MRITKCSKAACCTCSQGSAAGFGRLEEATTGRLATSWVTLVPVNTDAGLAGEGMAYVFQGSGSARSQWLWTICAAASR